MTRRTAFYLALFIAVVLGALLLTTAKPAHADGPITYAVAGDSISANPDSWLHQETDPSISYVGGYQHAGYTAGGVLANIRPVNCDVLVIMLGTNDVRLGIPTTTTVANIEAIAARVQARHVLITYLPPSNYEPDPGTRINRTAGNAVDSRALVALATRHRWLAVDPFAPWRAWTQRWAGGASTDRTHPTAAVSAQVAALMAGYIREAAAVG